MNPSPQQCKCPQKTFFKCGQIGQASSDFTKMTNKFQSRELFSETYSRWLDLPLFFTCSAFSEGHLIGLGFFFRFADIISWELTLFWVKILSLLIKSVLLLANTLRMNTTRKEKCQIFFRNLWMVQELLWEALFGEDRGMISTHKLNCTALWNSQSRHTRKRQKAISVSSKPSHSCSLVSQLASLKMPACPIICWLLIYSLNKYLLRTNNNEHIKVMFCILMEIKFQRHWEL